VTAEMPEQSPLAEQAVPLPRCQRLPAGQERSVRQGLDPKSSRQGLDETQCLEVH